MEGETMAAEFRIEIGLEGGQGVQMTTGKDEWAKLQKLLESGSDDWAGVTANDGAEYRIATGKVGYVRVTELTKHIGFRD
jgi:hypothetical protein